MALDGLGGNNLNKAVPSAALTAKNNAKLPTVDETQTNYLGLNNSSTAGGPQKARATKQSDYNEAYKFFKGRGLSDSAAAGEANKYVSLIWR